MQQQEENNSATEINDPHLPAIKAGLTKAEKMIAEFEIKTDEDLALVAGKIGSIETFKKAVKAAKKALTEPADAIYDRAKFLYDPIIKKCENFRVILDQRAIAYHEKKEKERKEAEAKIAAKVEQNKLLPETAVKKMEALPVVAKTLNSEKSSLSFKKTAVPVIADPTLIPDEYWIIDEVRLRRDALERNKNGQDQIPGVVIEMRTNTSSRSY